MFDCDRVEPDWARLEPYWYLAHTTYQHTADKPRWRVVLPLTVPVAVGHWVAAWRRAHAALCPETDPNCKDASRQYYLPSHPPGAQPEARCHEGRLLDPATLPALPVERRPRLGRRKIAVGALEQGDVEDALYAAGDRNGLVADDGPRQCWATIRSGLSAGLQDPARLADKAR